MAVHKFGYVVGGRSGAGPGRGGYLGTACRSSATFDNIVGGVDHEKGKGREEEKEAELGTTSG